MMVCGYVCACVCACAGACTQACMLKYVWEVRDQLCGVCSLFPLHGIPQGIKFELPDFSASIFLYPLSSLSMATSKFSSDQIVSASMFLPPRLMRDSFSAILRFNLSSRNYYINLIVAGLPRVRFL